MNFQPPFVVLGLARSRTAWLSKFLSYGPWICGHDELRHCRTLEDVKSWFMQPFIGTSETAGMHWWRLLGEVAPGARIVTVRRPVPEVVESVLKKGVPLEYRPKLMDNLRRADAKLDQLERRLPGVVTVKYEELSSPIMCGMVFEHCTMLPFDPGWWEHWNAVRVEADFEATLRYSFSYMKQTAALMLEARAKVLSNMTAKRDNIGDGLVIAEEPFESSWEDSQELLMDHCALVGEAPDAWARENVPVYVALDEMGHLQTMTARANGRMFGYLVTMVGSPMAAVKDPTATHTLFYASKEWPGAGLRLQRAALAALKAKGIETVYMRSGLGAGSRIEVLYKRLGAEPEGKLFKIRLGG